jgi:hypothetical protein
MERSHGRPEITVALIDGPVALDRPELATANIRALGGALHGGCTRADTYACMHGTFVAAMLAGRRGSVAPAICPGCTLLVRPVFAETTTSARMLAVASSGRSSATGPSIRATVISGRP